MMANRDWASKAYLRENWQSEWLARAVAVALVVVLWWAL